MEKQFGRKIAQVGYLPEPRFEDLIEDEPGYYSAMTVITMLNHLGSHHDALPTYPYLSGEAARYLASMKINAFGTDMPGLMSIVNGASSYETAPVDGDAYPEHTSLLGEDIVVIEGLTNLESIVGQANIVFAGFPIKVKDGNGAPLRAVALVY